MVLVLGSVFYFIFMTNIILLPGIYLFDVSIKFGIITLAMIDSKLYKPVLKVYKSYQESGNTPIQSSTSLYLLIISIKFR